LNGQELVSGQPLQAFAGERPGIPEHLLPGNVSPDGLNIDYREGTLRKRFGVKRLSRSGAVSGGVWVRSVYGSTKMAILETGAGVTLGGTLHTYECVVAPRWASVDGDYQVWRHVTSGSDGTGLWLKVSGGVYKWEARVKHSGGTLAVTQSSGTNPVSNTAQVVTVQYDAGTKDLTLTVAGTSWTGNIGGNTYTQPSGKFILGGESGSAYHLGAIVSDFRIWDGTVAASLQSLLRPLTSSEKTSALEAWWRFLPGAVFTDSGANANAFTDVTGSTVRNREQVGGFVPGLDTFDRIECVVPLGVEAGSWFSVWCATRRAVYRGDARGNAFLTSPIPVGSGALSAYRMQGLRYRGFALFVNGGSENTIAIVGTLGGFAQLSFAAPRLNAGGITITAAGSGGSLSAGDYLYVFSVYSTVTGVESAVAPVLSDVTAVLSDKATLDFTTGGFMPDRYVAGADKIRIYRTEANASVFYFVADVDIDTTSYEDGASDASIAVSSGRLNAYLGYAAPSRFAFEMDDRLWLGNQASAVNRLVYTEKFTLGAFYSENYVDVGAGDGDSLTGGIGVGALAVVFKRRSAWLVSSAGGAVQVQPLAAGVGCVQHATIAASHNAVYFLAEGGVYRLPLPLGAGAPEALMGPEWRSFFAAFTDDDFESCSGAWDPIGRRYVLGMRLDDEAMCLVWTASTEAWALWNADVGGFAYLSGGGENGLYCGWRNCLALLDGSTYDGAAAAYSGTLTGATSTTLTDSAATWPAASSSPNGDTLLLNVVVTVMDSTGGNVQSRTIIYNTGTVLTVDSAWTVTPSAGWRYMLGAIEGRWRSPRMALDRWDREKRIDQVRMLNVTPSAASGDESTGVFVADDRDEETFANSADARRVPFAPAQGQCFEVSVGVRQLSCVDTFEVGGIALIVEQQDGT
jgi:hypothetical protein